MNSVCTTSGLPLLAITVLRTVRVGTFQFSRCHASVFLSHKRHHPPAAPSAVVHTERWTCVPCHHAMWHAPSAAPLHGVPSPSMYGHVCTIWACLWLFFASSAFSRLSSHPFIWPVLVLYFHHSRDLLLSLILPDLVMFCWHFWSAGEISVRTHPRTHSLSVAEGSCAHARACVRSHFRTRQCACAARSPASRPTFSFSQFLFICCYTSLDLLLSA
ncbi:hypothetical protein OBBRIDRAFT_432160 [Obba rivulosa]|uniref:Uncharacterized protein n=1 Tax=Obba rivulosa TaxID=1052685 RepID=A0A8E2AGP5_9APHY|nr:hypothetical protein OBBRIDRAFT_432160 [Obba rivulosa]